MLRYLLKKDGTMVLQMTSTSMPAWIDIPTEVEKPETRCDHKIIVAIQHGDPDPNRYPLCPKCNCRMPLEHERRFNTEPRKGGSLALLVFSIAPNIQKDRQGDISKSARFWKVRNETRRPAQDCCGTTPH